MNRMQMQVDSFRHAIGRDSVVEPGLREARRHSIMITEEALETTDALEAGDFLKSIDGICDLIYVCMGAAVSWGIDLEPFFDEVHRCNMNKVGADKDPETGKQLKPADWVPPDHERILQTIETVYSALEANYHHTYKRLPSSFDMKHYFALMRVSKFAESINLEQYAKELRLEWTTYAVETLGDKAPLGYTRSWDDTGSWGKEGNRRGAQRVIDALLSDLIKFELGEILTSNEMEQIITAGGANEGQTSSTNS